MATHHERANFIWQIADLLRGPYRPPQYERVMLPFVVLRRFDYRLQQLSEGSISLNEGQAQPLDGPKEVGSGVKRDQPVPLSTLIDVINDRFGTDFTDADQYFFDQIVQAAVEDESLQQAAAVNPQDKFSLVFNRVLQALFVDRMEQNEDVFARFMNDDAFQKTVAAWMVGEVYKRLNESNEETKAT